MCLGVTPSGGAGRRGGGWRGASDLPSGLRSLVVTTRWQDTFLLRVINTFRADVQLWQRCFGQPLPSQWPQPLLLQLEQSLSAEIPSYSCPVRAGRGERHRRKLP